MISTRHSWYFNFWSWVLSPLRPLLLWWAAKRDASQRYYGLRDVVDFWIGARPEFDPTVYPTDARMQEQRIPPPEHATLKQKMEMVQTRIGALPPYLPWIILLVCMALLDFGASAGFLYNQGVTGWMLWLCTPAMTTVLFALATSTIREQKRKKERDPWLLAVRILFAIVAIGIGWLQYQETAAADEQDVLGSLASGLIWSVLVVGPAVVAHLLAAKIALVRPLILEQRRIKATLGTIETRIKEANDYLDRLDRARRVWEDEFRAIRGTYRRHWSRSFLSKHQDHEALEYFLTTEEPVLRQQNVAPAINPYARQA